MAAPVTVAGRFELPDNTPLDGGTMTFTLVPADIPDTVEPVVVLPGPVIVPISETGAFTVTVRATDDPDLVANVDGDLVYRVWRSANGHSARYTVAVPSPGPWDWTDLTPIPDSDAAVIVGGQGPPGVGVPPGGTSGQALVKASSSDFDTQWVTGGAGGGITTEDAVDAVAAALVEGAGIDIVYNDAANTITVTSTASGGGLDAEGAVDAVAAALVAGNNIDITYNDTANTITVDVEALTKANVGLGNVDNTSDAAKPVSSATQTALNAKADTARGLPAGGSAGQILGKTGGADYAVGWVADQVGAGGGIDAEAAVDAVAAALVAGNNIDVTYNDAANTITLDVEALTTADVAGLDAALTAKASTAQLSAHEADTTNIHGIADTTALATTAAVALKADKATTVTATAPLTGSGTLGANLTLGVATFSTSATTSGVVPGSNGAGATAYLNGTGTWTTPPGGGGGAGHASFVYNATTTAPPADTNLRMNATQLSATTIWVDKNDFDGLDVSTGLAKILAGYQIYIQDYDDATKWVKYSVTANAVDSGNYFTLAVAYHSGPGGVPTGSGAAGRVELQPIAPGTVGVPPGGTTGQVLAKTSGTDFAVGWDSDVTDMVAAATLTAAGKVELATTAEATAQTDNVRAVTPLGLADRVLTSRTITTTAPLTGGGDLTANRTFDISTFTATVKGAVPPPTTVTGKYLKDDGTWAVPAGGARQTQIYTVPGPLAPGTGTTEFVVTLPGDIVNVWSSVTNTFTGSSVIVDVNLNGVTIFTNQANRPTILAGSRRDTSGVPDAAAADFVAGDRITVDVDQVGTHAAADQITVGVEYTYD